MTTIAAANVAVRFLLELAALGAIAWWGYHAPSGPSGKLALGVGLPLLAAIVWGMFVAPNAAVAAPDAVRLVLQVAVFGAAAAALAALGRPALAGVFAVAVVANAVLMAAPQS